MTGKRLSDFPAVQEYLYALRNRGSKFGIERMQDFVERLGNPERAYPIIHVAGTNGKGSVSAMLEAALRHAGCKTGLTISPHLMFLGERIQINREPISAEAIVEFTNRLQPVAAAIEQKSPEDHPSFFEYIMAMAFLHFKEEVVDVAILETGLGGRLDASNVVDPEISIITSIGFDHMDLLGDTLEKIAYEKAGIIKAGRPVVLGLLPAEAEAVIRRVAAERNCSVYSVREVFGDDVSKYPDTNLEGSLQKANAATALLALQVLSSLPDTRIRPVPETLARKAFCAVDWAGRWQRITLNDGRTLILDATHNMDGLPMLCENIDRLIAERAGHRPMIITGFLGMDRARQLLPTLSGYADTLYAVQPKQPRACRTAELESISGLHCPLRPSSVSSLFPGGLQCATGGPNDTILVSGSIYLIGEICQQLYQTSAENELQDKI